MKKLVYLGFIMLALVACKKDEVSPNNNNSNSTSQVPLSDQIIGHWESHPDELDYDFTLKFCSDGTYQKDFKYNWQFSPCEVDYLEEGSWEVIGDTIYLTTSGELPQKYIVNNVSQGMSLVVNFQTCSGGNMNLNYSYVSNNGCSGGSGGTGGGVPPTTVNDIDGNTYNVIQIGSQFWLKEDLKVTKFKDGSALSQENWQNPTNWVSSLTPTYMEVDDSPTPYNVSTSSDGLVYNYVSGTDSRGLCPDGFRVPTKQDFQVLLSNYSTPVSAANALKSYSGWTSYFLGYGSSNPPNLMSGNGNNSSGFNAKPSGYIASNTANYSGIQGNWLINDNIYKNYLSIIGYTFFYGDPGSAEIIGTGGEASFHKCRCIYEQ